MIKLWTQYSHLHNNFFILYFSTKSNFWSFESISWSCSSTGRERWKQVSNLYYYQKSFNFQQSIKPFLFGTSVYIFKENPAKPLNYQICIFLSNFIHILIHNSSHCLLFQSRAESFFTGKTSNGVNRRIVLRSWKKWSSNGKTFSF